MCLVCSREQGTAPDSEPSRSLLDKGWCWKAVPAPETDSAEPFGEWPSAGGQLPTAPVTLLIRTSDLSEDPVVTGSGILFVDFCVGRWLRPQGHGARRSPGQRQLSHALLAPSAAGAATASGLCAGSAGGPSAADNASGRNGW